MTCTRDHTSRFFPSDSIFYQHVLCGFTRSTYWAYLPLSYLLVFVGKRGLTCMQILLLPPTCFADSLSSSVYNHMHRLPIDMLPLIHGAWRSPLIYPPNRARSDGRPRPIRCHRMCSQYSGLWYWDASNKAANDAALSQRRGWRRVLSSFFEVHACQGRVTLF